MTTIMNTLKTRFFFPLLIFTFVGFQSEAFVFRVIGVRGKVKIKNGGTEQVVKPGNSLLNGQVLVVESGYCGLIHSKGKALDITTPGTYPIEELDKKVSSSNSARVKVSDKYFDYIMGQLSKKDAEDVEKSVKKYMEVPGAVQRSGSDAKTGLGTARINVFPNNEVLPSTYLISWEPVKDVKTYTVKINNRFDDIVFAKEVEGTSIDLDFSKIASPLPDLFTMQVTYQGTGNAKPYEYQFKVNKKNQLDLLAEEGPSSWMMNGMLCEENYFYLDAIRYYEQASKAEPEVEVYREALGRLKTKLSGN